MILSIKTAILGILQGITEFLPISSTGHMILLEKILPLQESFRESFMTIVQLGSILAVLLYFREKLIPNAIFKDLSARKNWFLLWCRIAAGVLPALLLGGLCGSYIQQQLYSPKTVAIALGAGGVALLLIERSHPIPTATSIEQLSWGQILGIGLAQCIAMIPGVSRSAATILGALLLKTDRETAVQYSFFLAIPTMLAATGYSLLKHGTSFSGSQWVATAIGLLTAFLVSWAVIAFLMKFIRKHNFQLFGYYRIILGILILLTLR